MQCDSTKITLRALSNFPSELLNFFAEKMATLCFSSFSPSKPTSYPPPKLEKPMAFHQIPTRKAIMVSGILGLGGLGLTLTGHASASELQQLLVSAISMELTEPANALSLPTWAIHVSSVVEWILAMALVWQYGEQSDFESWKGLSWGMVPLLGGALCACTWHFFYNAESLEVLVALQAALTVIGNATMCIAAFRIYKSSQERSEKI